MDDYAIGWIVGVGVGVVLSGCIMFLWRLLGVHAASPITHIARMTALLAAGIQAGLALFSYATGPEGVSQQPYITNTWLAAVFFMLVAIYCDGRLDD